jgi:hypothetical protein
MAALAKRGIEMWNAVPLRRHGRSLAPDETVMFLDDVFGDREAKALAALLFGGEEGIEDPGQDRGRYLAEGVACKKLPMMAKVNAIQALGRRVRAAAASSFSSG